MSSAHAIVASASYKFDKQLFEDISNLDVKDVRNVYNMIRARPDIDCHLFFPHQGFTVGDFCLIQIVKRNRMKIS